MPKKEIDPFGLNKAINWDKLEDPKVLKELEELFEEEEKFLKEISSKRQASSSKLQARPALIRTQLKSIINLERKNYENIKTRMAGQS